MTRHRRWPALGWALAATAAPSPASRPAAIAGPAVTLEVVVYGDRGGSAAARVPTDRTFRSGERIRFGVLASHDGRLVMLHKGASGSMSAIYPDRRLAGGSNAIEGGNELLIPQRGWFVFDEKAGTETVYAVYSTRDGGGGRPTGTAIVRTLVLKHGSGP